MATSHTDTPSISRWIPVESNPEVMNSWSSKLGLRIDKFQFEDVYGLDEEVLAFVHQPVKALILCFPITAALEEKRKEKAQGAKVALRDPPLLFIKQTIPNACGTIALLHAIANSDVDVEPGSSLAQFFEQCKRELPLRVIARNGSNLTCIRVVKSPKERAELLENTELFASAHAQSASAGQSAVPTNLDTDLHFVAFVQGKVSGKDELRLLELDGRFDGPLDHGVCKNLLLDASDVLSSIYLKSGPSVNFGLMALGPAET